MMKLLVRSSNSEWSSTYLRFFLTLATVAPCTLASAQFQGAPPAQMSTNAQPSLIDPSAALASSTLTLLPGDVFEVQIFNVPKFDYKGRLDEKGVVTLPLIGDVKLGGLSLSGAEALLQRTLTERQMINDPHVILTVLESPNRFATIIGEVKTAGPVPVYGDKRLLDVISAAGGLTPASSPVIDIYRRGESTPIKVELSGDASRLSPANVMIHPGDSIVVSRVGVVYVIGATRLQGAIPLKNATPLTLVEALSLAGGVNFEAARGKAYILRVNGESRLELPFDVSKVLTLRTPDILLRNDDIILIPTDALKAALKSGAVGVAASLVAGVGYIAVR